MQFLFKKSTTSLNASNSLFSNPTPDHAGFAFVWNTTRGETLDYLSITDTPEMKVGYR